MLVAFIQVSSAWQGEYLHEFDYQNEHARVVDSWFYLTRDGIHREVEIYEYCSTECILVIFDVRNNVPLDLAQTKNFFENYGMKDVIIRGEVNEDLYKISLGESLVCKFFIPKFGEGVKNLVVQVADDKVLPKLPKNAGKIASRILQSGKELGLVKNANILGIIFGASCLGGGALENSATSTLTSCRTYIHNLVNNNAYEGQSNDLIECHREAISKLNRAKYSPGVLFQTAEVSMSNTLKKISSSIRCGIGWLTGHHCKYSNPVNGVANYDIIVDKIQKLEESTPDISYIASWAVSKASRSSERLTQKGEESWMAISYFNAEIERTEHRLSELKPPLFDYLFFIYNAVTIPPYDFSSIESGLSTVKGISEKAKHLYSNYKFNSVYVLLEEGYKHISVLSDKIELEENITRERNLLNIFLIFLSIILIASLIVRVKSG
jgi:hypothetical protein